MLFSQGLNNYPGPDWTLCELLNGEAANHGVDYSGGNHSGGYWGPSQCWLNQGNSNTICNGEPCQPYRTPGGEVIVNDPSNIDSHFRGNPNAGHCGGAGGGGNAQGACCVPDGSGDCTLETQADCEAAGNHYWGDGTSCGGFDCTIGQCCITQSGNSACFGVYTFNQCQTNASGLPFTWTLGLDCNDPCP